jgi:hypothetical protein
MELLLIVLISFGAVVTALAVGERLEHRSGAMDRERCLQDMLRLSADFTQQLLQEGVISQEQLARVTELLTMYMLGKNGLSIDAEERLLIQEAAANICRENSRIF